MSMTREFRAPEARCAAPRLGLLPAILLVVRSLALAARPSLADVSTDDDCCSPAPSACAICRRPQDQVWLLDARNLGCLDDASARDVKLGYERYDLATDGWQRRRPADFFSGPGAKLPTVVWVHGDLVDDSRAREIGLTVYRELIGGHCAGPPLRFVIWSWPSERVFRLPLKDARLKAERTVPASYRLAWCLNRFDPKSPVSLIGYSYGSRIVASTLHLLGGGALEDGASQGSSSRHAATMWCYWPAALDYDLLEPGKANGRALSQVDRLVLLNNPCDRILAHYDRLPCGGGGPPALGYEGVADLKALGANAARLRQVDASPYVGPRHRWWLYIESPTLIGEIRKAALPASREQSATRNQLRVVSKKAAS